ncbi:MAG: hypothetical protein GTN80_00495 [Nitrososphaeria archaeon]|nr:hypothetical protein [Nitrososphaeria archaeon]NIQ32124.1 hypothetical protein [Nitrososphaeria archaeon]
MNTKTSLPILLTLMILAAVPVAAATLTVTTDKTYDFGDTLMVSGSGAAGDTAVSVSVYNPNDLLVGIAQSTSDVDGNYAMEVLTFPSAASSRFPAGTYTVKAYNLGDTAETTFTLATGVPPPTPTVGEIAISVDAGATYYPGETATFFALTTVSGEPMDVDTISFSLWIPGEVNAVSLAPTSVTTGLYKVTYMLPAEWNEGQYVLMVTAENEGYKGAAVKGFQVSKHVHDMIAGIPGAVTDAVSTKIEEQARWVKWHVDKAREDIADLSASVSMGFDSVQSSISGAVKYIGDSTNYLKKVSDASTMDIKGSMSAGFDGVQSSISGAISYLGDSVQYLKGVTDASASKVEGTVINARNDIVTLLVQSQKDILPFLIAITVLVIVAIVLAAIAAIRTSAE